MKTLLYKEYKLVVVPVVYLFLSFILLLMIPGYPYTVSFFYTCLGIFFCFQTSRENKDILYMITLPVAKKDIVKARYLTVLTIEGIQILLSLPVAVLRGTVLNYKNVAGIEADAAFFGIAFIIFGVFNWIFMGTYFKNVFRVGVAFVKSIFGVFAVILLAEASVHIARAVWGTCFWDSMKMEDQLRQLPVLAAGVVFFAVVTAFRYRLDIRHFEKQDL